MKLKKLIAALSAVTMIGSLTISISASAATDTISVDVSES